MNFRKSLLLFAIPLAIATLEGCQKELVENNEVDTPVEQIVDPEQGKLVSATLKSVQPVEEAVQNAFAKAGSIYQKDELLKSTKLFESKFFGTKWQLETYRITYNTKDYRGKTIQLCGDIAFINGTTRFAGPHSLSNIFVFNTMFSTNMDAAVGFEPIVMPTRALRNSLVVFPLYQGVAGDEGINTISVAEPLLKARQTIDCELAAIEFLKQKGIALEEGYYTENVGISNGSGAALAFQYLLEGTPWYEGINSDIIRLRGTYCAEGCYSFSRLVPMVFEPAPELEGEDLLTRITKSLRTVCFVAVVAGTFDAWKGVKKDMFHEFFEHTGKAEDFFSDKFINETPAGGYKNYVEYFRSGTMPMGDSELINMNVHEMVNPCLLDENGCLKMEHPYVKDLISALSVGDVMLDGWTPKSGLRIAHSKSDDFIPFSQPEMVYENLSNNGFNRNVSFVTKESLGHLDGTLYFFLRDIILKDHPCPID